MDQKTLDLIRSEVGEAAHNLAYDRWYRVYEYEMMRGVPVTFGYQDGLGLPQTHTNR